MILILIIVLVVVFLFCFNKSLFTNTIYYDIVFSINVHENKNFILKQLENIKENVQSSYCVIFNCNDLMYQELKNEKIPNVFINDKVINKKRFHGSLFHGIYSNMEYALKNMNFRYFIVLSSRTLFFKQLDIIKLQNAFNNKTLQKNAIPKNISQTNDKWHWGVFKKTLLSKYYKNLNLYGGFHEGLMLTYTACNKVIEFFKYNKEIFDELINLNGPVEEFAIQTILTNKKIQFISLNYGSIIDKHVEPPTWENPYYTHKTIRN